jgi:hypothetical protein
VARARYNDLAQEWQIGVMTARDVLQVHSLLTWGATPWGREAVDYTRPHSSHAPAIGSTLPGSCAGTGFFAYVGVAVVVSAAHE